MRACIAILIALISLVSTAAGAQERSAAIFDFELVDTDRDNQLAPHDAEHQVRLVGADLAITGTVFKVSNLILNMIIFVRDMKTAGNVAAAQADMRSDTDQSWNRTLDRLLRNRLLARDYGAPR
jgi:hypothetical protein